MQGSCSSSMIRGIITPPGSRCQRSPGDAHDSQETGMNRMQTRILLLLSLVTVPATRTAADDKPQAYDPSDAYVERRIEGWLVRVHKQLFDKEHEELREETLKLLGDHLYRITRAVPAGPLAKLRKTPIWIELNHPRHPCMCYHPSAAWLREHQMNPAKAGAVEIANCRNFLSWTGAQPWMVLHELAHAYHHQVLGFEHAEVQACYDQ